MFEGHYPLPLLPSRVPQPRISIVKPGAYGGTVGRGFLKEGYRGFTWGGLVDTGTWWACLGPTAWRAGAVGTPTSRDHTALGHAVPRLPAPGTPFLSMRSTPPQPKLTPSTHRESIPPAEGRVQGCSLFSQQAQRLPCQAQEASTQWRAVGNQWLQAPQLGQRGMCQGSSQCQPLLWA